MFDLDSPLLAPRWLDGPQPLRGYEAAPFLAAIIDVRYLVPATGSSTPAGFAVLPVLRRPPGGAPGAGTRPELYVAAGAFQLPLFKGVPSMALLAEMKRSGDVEETLAQALRVCCVPCNPQIGPACCGLRHSTTSPRRLMMYHQPLWSMPPTARHCSGNGHALSPCPFQQRVRTC